METKKIGLGVYQVYFKLSEKEDFEKFKKINENRFLIEEIFINNGYGYEIKPKFVIYEEVN